MLKLVVHVPVGFEGLKRSQKTGVSEFTAAIIFVMCDANTLEISESDPTARCAFLIYLTTLFRLCSHIALNGKMIVIYI
jgi:hypothetical protein